MKKQFLALMALLPSAFSYCQSSQNYDCPHVDKLFFKSEVDAKFGQGRNDLVKYFDSSFKKNNCSFDAKIMVNIIVDSTGSTCCNLISKLTDGQVDFKRIHDIVNSMPKWISAKQNGHDVNSNVILLVFYTDERLAVLPSSN